MPATRYPDSGPLALRVPDDQVAGIVARPVTEDMTEVTPPEATSRKRSVPRPAGDSNAIQ